VVGGCLRPGYLPVPYVIMVLLFVGLLTARVFDLPLSQARRAGGPQPPGRGGAGLPVLAVQGQPAVHDRDPHSQM